MQQTEFHSFLEGSIPEAQGQQPGGFKAFFDISGFGLTGDENTEAKKIFSKKL